MVRKRASDVRQVLAAPGGASAQLPSRRRKRRRSAAAAGGASIAWAERTTRARGTSLRSTLDRLRGDRFTVRRVAETLDAEAGRLARLYGGLLESQEWEPDDDLQRSRLEPQLVAPLVDHLSRGVRVSDIHKMLNGARQALFLDAARVPGRRAALHLAVEQAIAVYVIWRLGHSFCLVPEIRQSIATQITYPTLQRIAAGEKLGLALTPFVATIDDLEALSALGYAEVVAFSLTGLVEQALQAFRP